MIQVKYLVRASLPNADGTEIRYQIFQIITDKLLGEIRGLRSIGKGVATNITLDTVIGLMPPPWGVVSNVALNIPEIAKLMKAHNSWITLFMKLRTSERNS